MIFQLDENIWFPHPEIPLLDDDLGMVAIGGDLRIDRLLFAYDHGFFPWYAFENKEIQWFCPVERFVIFPQDIHVSHSMRTLMNKHLYHVTFNTAFDQVIRNCSTVDNRVNMEGAWLGNDIIDVYTKLHEMGRARSVEVWRGEKLVGGFYGVTCGNGFVGESMFSLEPNTSKLALIAYARQMQEQGGALIDCQIYSPHPQSMGGHFISYKEYISILFGKDAYHTWMDEAILKPEN